jgi:hypothetical protein
MESPASRRRRGLVLLAEADVAEDYLVSGVYERDRHLLEFLEARGIRPGAELRLVSRNYDQTLSLVTQTGKVNLGVPAAEKIWVSSPLRTGDGQTTRLKPAVKTPRAI